MMRATARRLVDGRKRLTGRISLAALVVLVGVALLGAWTYRPVFLMAIVLVLTLLVHIAIRWPRAALVGAVLATLTDPYVLQGLVPTNMEPLLAGFSETVIVVVGVPIVVRAARAGSLVAAFRDPVTLLGAAFVAVAAASALVNGVPALVATLGVVVTVDALAVYYLVRMLPFDRRGITIAVGALVAAATLAALLGIAQFMLTPEILWFRAFAGSFGEGSRVTGFLGNPNLLAALIGLALPFPLYAARHLPSVADRRLAVGVAIVLALGLVMTFSRGGWASVLLGVGIGALLIDRRILLLVAAVGVAAYFVVAYAPRDLLVDPAHRPAYADGLFDSLGRRLGALVDNDDLRLRYIVEGMPIILDHPIIGVGPGRYGGAVATIIESPIYAEYGASLYGYRTVHDFWLHTLGEVGVAGTVLVLTMVLGLILRLVRAARRAMGMDRVLMAGIATSGIVMTLNNLTEMLLEGNFPAFAIWMLLAFGSLMAGSVVLERRHTPSHARPPA